MPYTTFTIVRSIVDSDVTDAEITTIITWSDAVIDLQITPGSMTAPFLQMLSSKMSALTILLKDPNARSLGEYSERRDVALQMLKDEVTAFIVVANGGVNVLARMEGVS